MLRPYEAGGRIIPGGRRPIPGDMVRQREIRLIITSLLPKHHPARPGSGEQAKGCQGRIEAGAGAALMLQVGQIHPHAGL